MKRFFFRTQVLCEKYFDKQCLVNTLLSYWPLNWAWPTGPDPIIWYTCIYFKYHSLPLYHWFTLEFHSFWCIDKITIWKIDSGQIKKKKCFIWNLFKHCDAHDILISFIFEKLLSGTCIHIYLKRPIKTEHVIRLNLVICSKMCNDEHNNRYCFFRSVPLIRCKAWFRVEKFCEWRRTQWNVIWLPICVMSFSSKIYTKLRIIGIYETISEQVFCKPLLHFICR